MKTQLLTALPLAVALTPFAAAQDSVSLGGCLPGDAVDMYADGTSAFGSEVENAYVVQMDSFLSSWGNDFAIAPIAKTGKTNSQFFNNLMGAQAISRSILTRQPFSTGQYMEWSQPGLGVNNDPSKNSPGALIDATFLRGPQFAAGFREFGTTDLSNAANAIVTTIVNVDPTDTSRLYVRRIQSATNACMDGVDLSTFGFGGVDASGHTTFRADGFGVSSVGCGGFLMTGNSIYVIDAANRNVNFLNVIEDGGTLLDVPATAWIVQNSTDTHTTPTMIPSEVTGGAPRYIGLDFNSNYEHGTANPPSSSLAHFAAGLGSSRGNLAYTKDDFGPLGSSAGIAAMLASTGAGTDSMNVFGLDAAGNPTGTIGLTLPATITDNATGFTNLAGANMFDHYHSQVAFQGGNGQVALRVDPLGNLLVAGVVDHPSDTGPTHGGNYIVVAKVDAFGATSWTMAGYNDNAVSGKPILNAPSSVGGVPVAQMVDRTTVLGVSGPSMSAPMFDANGSVWFLSQVELLGLNEFPVALIRAVYDPATFSYELEMVCKLGDMFESGVVGSGIPIPLNWVLTDLRLVDSNSVDSATAWSGNITDDAFLGYDRSSFAPADPRSLGGIVLQGRMLYDADQDFLFDGDCTSNGTADEEYRVLLYIAPAADSGYEYHGQSCPGNGGFHPVLTMDGFPAAGNDVTLSIEDGDGNQPAVLLLGLSPIAPTPYDPITPCFLNVNALPAPTIPLFLPGQAGVGGSGSISFSAPIPAATPPGVTIHLQAFCGDSAAPAGITSTRGVGLTTQL